MIKKYILGLISWKTLYKLLILIVTISFLIIGYLRINNINDNNGIVIINDVSISMRPEAYWTSFKITINVLIIVYFLNTLFFYKEEGLTKLTGTTIKITLSCYASFTIIVFWTVIFPWILNSFYFNLLAFDWIIITFQSAIIPLACIIYIVITSNDKVSWQQFFSRKLFIIFLYPVAYYIFLIVNGILKIQDYEILKNLNISSKIIFELIYRYPFIAFHQNISFINLNGIFTSIMFMFIFIFLLLLLIAFYIWIFNHIFKIKNRR